MRHLKQLFVFALISLFSVSMWADTPAAAGTTLFSEDFSSYSASEVPSGSVTTATGRVVYGGAYVTYSCTDGGSTTQVYNQNTGGGTAPEILVSKSNGTFVVAGIPSGGAQVITVSLTQNNQALSVAPTGTGYSGSVSGKPGAVGTRTFDITLADGADATFTLTFTGSGSSNVRVDDILVTVKTAGEGAGTPKCATPTFSPAAGSYEGTQNVTITSTTGATIYYTTDGSDPTTSGTKLTYSDPIAVSATTTLKAYATLTSYDDSEVATAAYTITEGPDAVIDFTSNTEWGFPTSKQVDEGTYSDGTYTVKVAGSSGNGFNFSSGKLLLGKTGAYVILPEFANPIEKIVCPGVSGASAAVTWNIFDGSEAVSTQVTGCTTDQTFEIENPEANKVYTIKVTGNANLQIAKVKIYFGAAPAVAKPTISGDENFVTSTTVTLACSTTGAEIYYTTDGSDPKTSGSIGTSFSLTETKTVRAIAKLGSDWSAEATPKTFTKVTPMTTAAELRSFATSSAQNAFIQLDGWKVTFVNGNNAYMIDPSNEGVILNNASHGYVAGDELNDEVVEASVKLASGRVQLSGFTSTNITATSGTATAAEIADFSTLTLAHQSRLVTLKDATYASSTSTFSDGVNSIYYYDQFSANPTLVDGATYDVTGIVIYYKSGTTEKVQIAPREATDVVSKGSVVIPTAANLAALKAADRGTYILTLTNAVVTYVNGNNAFIEDATGGALIYFASHGYSAGDCLNGDYQVTTTTYQGKFEITAMEPQAGAATTTAEIPLTAVTIATLNASFSSYESRRIKIAGANVTDAISGSDRNGTINDGAELAVYAAVASTITLTADDNVDIIGYPGFHNTDQQLNVWQQSDITVNEKADPGISWDPESAELTLNDYITPADYPEPGLIILADLGENPLESITLSSDNESLATINKTTDGQINISWVPDVTGIVHFTATFAGNDTYKAVTAVCTVTIKPETLPTQNVVILAVYDTKYYAMSTTNANNGFTAIAVEYDGSQVTVNSAEDKAAIQWTKTTSGDNTTFQDADDKYMKSADGATMSLQDAVCNWVWDATGEYYKIDGTARTFFYQNTSGGIFKNYATSNFNKSGYSDKAEVIVIDPANIVISSKVSAELAYDPASDEITQGDAWSAPSLVNPHSVAITSYNSDNESVATVTDGGVIALASGTGTAHITAHFSGDASYLAGDAVYTITVNAPAPIPSGTTYTKVTSTGDITDGEYLIVYETTSVAFNGALETLDAEGNSVAVVISGDEIAGTTAIDAAVFTIDVAAGTLQSASGHYIGVSSNSNGLKQTDDAATYTHTFSIDGDGNAVILADFESSTMKLRYNPSTSAGNLRFRYYKNDGQQAIQLYKKEAPAADYTRDDMVSPGVLGTICLEYNVPLAQASGAVFYELAGRSADGKIAFDEITTGELEAGKPYVFQATADQIQIFYGSTHVTEPDNSGALKGTFSATTIENTDPNWANIYYFANKALWGTSDLTSLSVPANRAYLVLSEVDPVSSANPAPGRRRITMNVNGEQIATGFENIESGDVPMKVMIEGTLYILRGEKVFDATGRLVK